jgi:hypothetical protein
MYGNNVAVRVRSIYHERVSHMLTRTDGTALEQRNGTHAQAIGVRHPGAPSVNVDVSNVQVRSTGGTLLATGPTGTVGGGGKVLATSLTLQNGAALAVGTQYRVSLTNPGYQPPRLEQWSATCTALPPTPTSTIYQFSLDVLINSFQPPGNSAAGTGATQYKVQIDMTKETADDLANGNFNLFGFKSVQTSQGGGVPVVWFTTKTYSTTTLVTWQTQYQAYTSSAADIPDGQVTASFSLNIDLGQTLVVTNGSNGTGDVENGGTSTAISIQNATTSPFTTGISQVVGSPGVASPLCAFPLYGQQMDVIAPIEKVLLMFSSAPVDTGAVIEQAYSPGILIDLTSANFREVSYDINKGWSWGNAAWAQQVPPNAELAPLLIEVPQATYTPHFHRHTLVD